MDGFEGFGQARLIIGVKVPEGCRTRQRLKSTIW
jgi:hypothetical protein